MGGNEPGDPAVPESAVRFDSARFAAWTGGAWDGPPPAGLDAVSQNGRSVPAGGLYVAIQGEKHDGHAFVAQAQSAGAAAALVRRDWPRPDGVSLPLLRVADTRRALAAAAAAWRRASGAFVVGLTGSAGKTTTKEFAAAMLAAAGPTPATAGNLNNDIGLPLSLLAMPAGTRFGVFEAGSNHPGEIAALAAVLQPDAAIVTLVGPVHIEFFGTEEAIADEKADLLRAVPPQGFCVLARDSRHFDYLRRQARARVVTVALGDGDNADFCGRVADVNAGDVDVAEPAAGTTLRLHTGLPGAHNAANLLLAAAAARTLGASWAQIEAGLARVRLPPMRWQRSEGRGVAVINDAYNANTPGMVAALDTFAAAPAPGRRVLVLGEMRELGAHAEALHSAVGRRVPGGPWQALVAVGPAARWIADEAVAGGFPAAAVRAYADAASAAADAAAWSRPGDTILLKASRGVGLEAVAGALTGECARHA